MRRQPSAWVSALALLAASGCGSDGGGGGGNTTPQNPESVIDLRADVNRNGTVDLADATEDQAEETWDTSHGAIFLANVDDDSLRCPKGQDMDVLTDVQLSQCFDAADEVVNGDEDLADMARLRTVPWPEAPDDAIGHVTVAAGKGNVRLFKNNGGQWSVLPEDGTLTPAELRAGVELAIEGKDVLRDASVWDGFADVVFDVSGGTDPKTKKAFPSGQDTVRLRMAPILLSHHLQAPEQIYATLLGGSASDAFRTDLGNAAGQSNVPQGLHEADPFDLDQWTQDWMEIGWMSMPAAGGAQHKIDVYIRSANVEKKNKPESPLRPAGRYVYQTDLMHGKDVAGVTPSYDINHSGSMDSLNSYGNTETIPPYELNGQKFPMGRLFRGSVPSFFPDPAFQKMLDAQAVQPIVNVDTSWLLVGHVDETISFLKMDNARGWGLLINDAALAKKMLEDLVTQGNGDVPFFVGLQFLTDAGSFVDAQTSAKQILANTEVMKSSQEAVVEVDAQVEILKKEVGLTDADFAVSPFTHWPSFGYSLAYQPGTVNGISLSDKDFGAPVTHGPDIGGKDPFQTQLETELAKHGITVRWIEDWDLYHRLSGEVHCGSNTKRALPVNKWWESGK